MSLADELRKLAELHRTGAISDDEYAKAKAKLLEFQASSTPEAEPSGIEQAPQAPTTSAAPKWMKPWGWLLVWLGAVGFVASAYVNWRSGREMEALFFGFLNPMFFIGVPVGLYWLSRSGVTLSGVLKAINESTLSLEYSWEPEVEGVKLAQGCLIVLVVGGVIAAMVAFFNR